MVGRPTGERGSSVMQQSLVSFSKYSLSNLALRSIVELERMNAGLDSNPDVFTHLATALRQTSEPSACTLPFRLVEPGYYESFERLYRMASTAPAAELDHIQSYMNTTNQPLSAAPEGPAESAA